MAACPFTLLPFAMSQEPAGVLDNDLRQRHPRGSMLLYAGLLACAVAASSLLPTNTALADTASKPQLGIASYYSDHFQGSLTASGAPFDQQSLTAAHPSLPLGTTVKVTRPATGQTVKVTINDRGPYAKGRIIDLSKRAARKLGMLKRGVASVRVTVVK